MLVFTDRPLPLGTMSSVWAVSLEAVNVSRKGASATERFQNPSPSDLKTRAFPKQCHGPDINSDTLPPFLGGKKGNYWTLSASLKTSVLSFPPAPHPHPKAAVFGSEPRLWHSIAATAPEFCAQWRELTISTQSYLATLYSADFGVTLSEQWKKEKNTPGVLCDLLSHLCPACEIGEGPSLNACASNYLKRCLAQ